LAADDDVVPCLGLCGSPPIQRPRHVLAPMLPNPQARWRALPDDALAWREWGGEVVVFNEQTGSTHLLGELAGEVLRRLIAAERGATVEALAAGLSADPGAADDAGWTGAVAEVLSEFARLGLAQPDKS